MKASDYRLVARDALKGFWVMSMIIALVAALLGGVSMGSSSNSANRGNNSNIVQESYQGIRNGNLEIPNLVAIAAAAVGAALGIGILIIILIQAIVGSFVELGYNLYNIKLINRDENRGLGTLFEHKDYFGSALGLRFMIGLSVFLWSLLLVIPGIIAAYNYSMAAYIMAEDPDIGPSIAMQRSKELMNGYKWELFCLQFSFIGWEILAALTLGIGNIALVPYQKAAETAFYMNITGRLNYRPTY